MNVGIDPGTVYWVFQETLSQETFLAGPVGLMCDQLVSRFWAGTLRSSKILLEGYIKNSWATLIAGAGSPTHSLQLASNLAPPALPNTPTCQPLQSLRSQAGPTSSPGSGSRGKGGIPQLAQGHTLSRPAAPRNRTTRCAECDTRQKWPWARRSRPLEMSLCNSAYTHTPGGPRSLPDVFLPRWAVAGIQRVHLHREKGALQHQKKKKNRKRSGTLCSGPGGVCIPYEDTVWSQAAFLPQVSPARSHAKPPPCLHAGHPPASSPRPPVTAVPNRPPKLQLIKDK